MVISKTPDSMVSGKSNRYLDVDKINKSLDLVTSNGATYAEVRLVALTDYSVAMRDGKLERAIPGQEIGATIRVLADQNALVINGNPVKIIYADRPEDIDYREYGISDAMVVDNTGIWTDRKGLSRHLRPGVSKVLLTAPAGDDIPNVVYGVNQDQITDSCKIISAAS